MCYYLVEFCYSPRSNVSADSESIERVDFPGAGLLKTISLQRPQTAVCLVNHGTTRIKCFSRLTPLCYFLELICERRSIKLQSALATDDDIVAYLRNWLVVPGVLAINLNVKLTKSGKRLDYQRSHSCIKDCRPGTWTPPLKVGNTSNNFNTFNDLW